MSTRHRDFTHWRMASGFMEGLALASDGSVHSIELSLLNLKGARWRVRWVDEDERRSVHWIDKERNDDNPF